jgi:galactose mutarotase-like enzyme
MGGAQGTLDWTYKGMRTLLLENSSVKVSILLDKGTDIFQVLYKPLDIDLLWHSPKGYRNATQRIQSITDQVDAFTDSYGGGWNDIFPNYGFASHNRGTKFGLHGESALLPWTCTGINQTSKGVEALVGLDCIRYPIRAEKTYHLSAEKPILSIKEDLTNIGEQDIELSWAQHIAFGEPFVGEDLKIEIPATKARTHDYHMAHERVKRNVEFNWPLAPALNRDELIDLSKIPAKEERVQEDFPITELSSPEYALYNRRIDLGVRVQWNGEAFPYLWYWLNWGTLNYPWFGRGRTLALEPTTTTSTGGLQDQIADGTAVILKPGEKLHGELEMELFSKTE